MPDLYRVVAESSDCLEHLRVGVARRDQSARSTACLCMTSPSSSRSPNTGRSSSAACTVALLSADALDQVQAQMGVANQPGPPTH